MFAFAGNPSLGGSLLTWNLFFARQPEPDLEFTEEELEQTTTVRSPSPKKPPKQSNGRPILWVLLLVLIGGGAYVAMEPEMVMEYIEPLLGESPEPPTPIVQRPMPPKPVAPAPQPMEEAPTPPPAVAPVEVPQAATPAPVPIPPSAPSMPNTSATVETIPTPVPASDTPVTNSPPPLFGEGQRVSVLPNPAAPGQKVVLTQDAEGSRPGLAIPPGTVLTVLDGDLQGTGWVYSVRSDYGTTGWLPEHQLRLKP